MNSKHMNGGWTMVARALACAGVAMTAVACGGTDPSQDQGGDDEAVANVDEAFVPGLNVVKVVNGQFGTFQDTYIDSAAPNANKANVNPLAITKNAAGAKRKALLFFDVSFI